MNKHRTAAPVRAEGMDSLRRAKIVVASSGKGGVGQSTLCICLSTGLASSPVPSRSAEPLRVLVIDADPQATATQWWAAAQATRPLPFDLLSMASAGESIARQMEPLSRMYDVIVVDMPKGLSQEAPLSGLLVADLCITALRPAPLDMQACIVDSAELVAEARKLNPTLQHRYLLNMHRKTKVAADVVEVLAERKAPMVEHTIGDRTVFQLAAGLGSVPGLMGSAYRTAADEVASVVEALRRLLYQEAR